MVTGSHGLWPPMSHTFLRGADAEALKVPKIWRVWGKKKDLGSFPGNVVHDTYLYTLHFFRCLTFQTMWRVASSKPDLWGHVCDDFPQRTSTNCRLGISACLTKLQFKNQTMSLKHHCQMTFCRSLLQKDLQKCNPPTTLKRPPQSGQVSAWSCPGPNSWYWSLEGNIIAPKLIKSTK